MPRIALIVEYVIHPGNEAEFEQLLREHAEKCVEEEPGCLRFEVLRPLDDTGTPVAGKLMASELFESPQALVEHRKTARFERMSGHFQRLLASRKPLASEVLAP